VAGSFRARDLIAKVGLAHGAAGLPRLGRPKVVPEVRSGK
jgi:hypothetical protein